MVPPHPEPDSLACDHPGCDFIGMTEGGLSRHRTVKHRRRLEAVEAGAIAHEGLEPCGFEGCRELREPGDPIALHRLSMHGVG